MKYVFWGVIILVLIILAYAYYYAMDSPYRISSEKAKQLIRNNQIDLILDVRTDFERQTLGSYPNSVHMPASELSRMYKEYPDKSIRILAYCNSGQRSRAAAEKLHSMGYVNARYIVATYGSLLD
jgi:rhodanese-related sulfurtransferase